MTNLNCVQVTNYAVSFTNMSMAVPLSMSFSYTTETKVKVWTSLFESEDRTITETVHKSISRADVLRTVANSIEDAEVRAFVMDCFRPDNYISGLFYAAGLIKVNMLDFCMASLQKAFVEAKQQAESNLAEQANKLENSPMNLFHSGIESAVAPLAKIYDTAISIVGDVLEGVKETVKIVTKGVPSILGTAVKAAVGVTKGAQDLVLGIGDGAEDLISNLPTMINDVVDGALGVVDSVAGRKGILATILNPKFLIAAAILGAVAFFMYREMKKPPVANPSIPKQIV